MKPIYIKEGAVRINDGSVTVYSGKGWYRDKNINIQKDNDLICIEYIHTDVELRNIDDYIFDPEEIKNFKKESIKYKRMFYFFGPLIPYIPPGNYIMEGPEVSKTIWTNNIIIVN